MIEQGFESISLPLYHVLEMRCSPGTAGPAVGWPSEVQRFLVETSHITGHEACGDRLGSSCPCKVRHVLRSAAGLKVGVLFFEM
jgi:hypothetical protein